MIILKRIKKLYHFKTHNLIKTCFLKKLILIKGSVEPYNGPIQ